MLVSSLGVRTFVLSPLWDILAADGLDRLVWLETGKSVCDIRQIT